MGWLDWLVEMWAGVVGLTRLMAIVLAPVIEPRIRARPLSRPDLRGRNDDD
jgi:hypothetical protein